MFLGVRGWHVKTKVRPLFPGFTAIVPAAAIYLSPLRRLSEKPFDLHAGFIIHTKVFSSTFSFAFCPMPSPTFHFCLLSPRRPPRAFSPSPATSISSRLVSLPCGASLLQTLHKLSIDPDRVHPATLTVCFLSLRRRRPRQSLVSYYTII